MRAGRPYTLVLEKTRDLLDRPSTRSRDGIRTSPRALLHGEIDLLRSEERVDVADALVHPDDPLREWSFRQTQVSNYNFDHCRPTRVLVLVWRGHADRFTVEEEARAWRTMSR